MALMVKCDLQARGRSASVPHDEDRLPAGLADVDEGCATRLVGQPGPRVLLSRLQLGQTRVQPPFEPDLRFPVLLVGRLGEAMSLCLDLGELFLDLRRKSGVRQGEIRCAADRPGKEPDVAP